jgi:hypothetical protein
MSKDYDINPLTLTFRFDKLVRSNLCGFPSRIGMLQVQTWRFFSAAREVESQDLHSSSLSPHDALNIHARSVNYTVLGCIAEWVLTDSVNPMLHCMSSSSEFSCLFSRKLCSTLQY